MTQNKVFTVPYRRKKTGKTDYKARLSLLKSKALRLVIRKSNKHMLLQLVKYTEKGDTILKSAHTKELSAYGWGISSGNIPAAYLAGLLIGVKANGQTAILDIGLQSKIRGSRIFAALKGASDGGLKINLSEEALPKDERITGKHISDFADKLKGDTEKYNKIFSGYLKNKNSPEKIGEYFEKAKQGILSKGNQK